MPSAMEENDPYWIRLFFHSLTCKRSKTREGALCFFESELVIGAAVSRLGWWYEYINGQEYFDSDHHFNELRFCHTNVSRDPHTRMTTGRMGWLGYWIELFKPFTIFFTHEVITWICLKMYNNSEFTICKVSVEHFSTCFRYDSFSDFLLREKSCVFDFSNY